MAGHPITFVVDGIRGTRTPGAALKDNARTSIGALAAPRIISGVGPRAAAMYALRS